MTKQTNFTFANDVNRRFELNDKDVKNQLTYFLNRWVNDVKWNTGNKTTTIQNLEQENLDLFIEHKENGVDLDNDKILHNNNLIAFYKRMQVINADIQAMMQEASEQLFPQEHATSKELANQIDELEARYQAQRAAS